MTADAMTGARHAGSSWSPASAGSSARTSPPGSPPIPAIDRVIGLDAARPAAELAALLGGVEHVRADARAAAGADRRPRTPRRSCTSPSRPRPTRSTAAARR